MNDEHHQIEKEPSLTHRQLAMALHAANAGAWKLSYQDNHLSWSDELYKIFGLVPGKDVITYDRWKESVYPEDLQRLNVQLSGAKGGSGHVALEYRIILPSGETRWVYDLGDNIHNRDGNLMGRAGICFDITERKQAMEEVERYGKLFRYISDMVIVVGRNGFIKNVNPSFARTLGYSEDELKVKPLLEFIHPDDRQRTIDEMAMQIQGNFDTLNFENRYVCKDGTHRLFAWNAYFERKDQVFYGIARDITERRFAEEALAASQEKYHRLVEGLGERYGVFSHSVEGIFLYASRHFHKLFGVSADKIIGCDWRTLNLSPESLALGEAVDRRVVEERCIQTVELISTHPDGSQHIIEVTYGPVIEDDRVVLMEGICTDITEMRQNTAALAAAKETADVANRAKSEFLANMSHEIRTPITCILGYAELLEDTELSPSQQQYVEVIASSTNNLIVLVDDILDLSKIEAGRIVLDYKDFSLREMLGKMIESQLPIAQAKGLSINIDIPADIPDRLTGDPVRLEQILLNLVGNAIKFTEKGKISLAVAVEEQQPSTTLLRFDVTDTGIGIKLEDQARIFIPFSQVDSSMTRKYNGTGLGLAICTQLSALMEGAVWVDSLEGCGSTFHVRIPFALCDAPLDNLRLTTSDLPPLWCGEPCRILLVEDYEVSQKFFAEVLRKHGHHVDVAQNGAEALSKWQRDDYDIILMDLQMPVMDGNEALRKLREMETERGTYVPVIALTAHAMADHRLDAMSRGFDGYLSKPTRIKELFREIQRCLGDRGPC